MQKYLNVFNCLNMKHKCMCVRWMYVSSSWSINFGLVVQKNNTEFSIASYAVLVD